MAYKIIFVGGHAHENKPTVALYAVDAGGRIGRKIATAADDRLTVPDDAGAVAALGPDVDNPADLDPKGFVILRLADQLPQWEQKQEIMIPAAWWRGWLWFTICLSGNVSRCFPFFLTEASLRPVALGRRQIVLPESCAPLCSGVVEIWRSNVCCFPIPIIEYPRGLASLEKFLAANPIMFPRPPQPDPGPVDRELAARVDAAFSAGAIDRRFVPSIELAEHVQTLRTLPAQEAISYVEANPTLWRFWCTESSVELGETPLNPDGSFSFCYRYFPFWLFRCTSSYFYKVKQLINGVWTYVYDGQAANQYFAADQVANLITQSGLTCGQSPPIPGDTVTLQAIGTTSSWFLNSHWNGADAAGNDLTQTGPAAMAIPGTPGILPAGCFCPPQDAGLLLAGSIPGYGAPWTGTLYFSLNFGEGMEGLGATYYRMSTQQADSAGNPMAGAPLQPITSPIAWTWQDNSVFPPVIRSQPLGPVTPAGSPNAGLYTIPYAGDRQWLGIDDPSRAGPFHLTLDTTSLPTAITGGPAPGNGRFLLILEIFNASGQRMVPSIAQAAAGEVAAPFNYIRLLAPPVSTGSPGPSSIVPYASLAHMIWVDNRQVNGKIGYFQSSAGTQVCQFICAPPETIFSVGYYAYHPVMCDSGSPPAPVPTSSFMASYSLTYEEGLGGSSGTLDAGGDTNQPNSCPAGSAYALSPNCYPPPSSSASCVASSFGNLLDGQSACAFSITLNVAPKHWDGFEPLSTLSWPAAVALSTGPCGD